MSFDILNKLFPNGAPDVSDFFAHDPQHGFTVSIVLGLTGEGNYIKAYEKFVAEHWKPTAAVVEPTVVAHTKPTVAEGATKPALSLKK